LTHKYSSYRLIGIAGVTRRASSYTPAAATRIRQFTMWVKRVRSRHWMMGYTNKAATIEWEIRTDSGADVPNTTAASLKSSGSFDYRFRGSPFKEDRLVEYTIHLATPITLAAATRYWFILKIPSDADDQVFPLGWADTYNEAHDATLHVAAYYGAAWHNEDASTYNLELSVLNVQAGVNWHVVVNGQGYMTPRELASLNCTQIASGLAQTRGGQAEWSQLRYPYTAIAQDDWTSGAGQLTMEDLHKFRYSEDVDTTVPRQVILGPATVKRGTLKTTVVAHEPTAIYMKPLPDDSVAVGGVSAAYMAQKFVLGAQLTVTTLGIFVGQPPYPARHTLDVAIFTDVGGSPGVIIPGEAWVQTTGRSFSEWKDLDFSAYSPIAAGTYWIVVRTTQGTGVLPEYLIGFDQDGSATDGVAKYSLDCAAWTAYDESMMFRFNEGSYDALNGDVIAYVYGSVNGTDSLFCAAGKKVYQWDEGNSKWVDFSTSIDGAADETTADITDICIFNDELWVAQGYDNHACIYDAAWADHDDNYKIFGVGKGYMWASTAENKVQKWNGATWSADITVGENLYAITAIGGNYANLLLVGKEDGIWEIDDKNLAREYTLFRSQAGSENCEGMCMWSGMLFVPVLDELWRWAGGSSYREVGPHDRNSGTGKKVALKIDDMAATAGLLWAAGTHQTVDDPANHGSLMAYNGFGWHYMGRHDHPLRNNKAVYVTSALGSEIRVWYAEGSFTQYISWPAYTGNRWDWSSATYTLHGGGVVTSWMDGGLKDALKFWNRVAIIADVPAGTYIDVYMAKDGEDWESRSLAYCTMLGTVTNASLGDNQEAILMFPDGLVAKSVQLVFMLRTTDTSKTPRLRAYSIETVVRQAVTYVHSVQLQLSDNLAKMDGTTETTRTGQSMWLELQLAAEENAPILFSVPYMTVRGFISNLSYATDVYKADDGGATTWERVIALSVIEAN